MRPFARELANAERHFTCPGAEAVTCIEGSAKALPFEATLLPHDTPLALGSAARIAVTLLTGINLDTTVATLRRIATSSSAEVGTIRIHLVVGAEIALFGAIFEVVSTVACQLASHGAGAVTSVVHAVVAGFSRIFDAVTAFGATSTVAGTLRGTILGSGVALLLGVKYAVATFDRRDGHLAVHRAGARTAVVDAVVTGFTEASIHRLVATVRGWTTRCCAELLSVGRGNTLVVRPGIADFSCARLNASVATAGPENASLGASAIRAVVLAVVTLLTVASLFDAVAAAWPEQALIRAFAIATRIVDLAVVTLLTWIDAAVAALELATHLARAL